MPELPDVEVFRRYARRRALHKKIEDVEVVDERILDGIGRRAFGSKLKGKRMENAVRHGKYLFLTDGDDTTLLMHFGMTGKLAYAKGEHDEEQYDKVKLWLNDGHALVYQCRRLLGKVSVVGNIEETVKKLGLGPDALDLSRKAFKETVASTRGMVKPFLMDQSKIAGIGNIYSDEILFQARMNPRKDCAKLSDKEVDMLHRATKEVLKTAIARKAHPSSLPDDYLLPHRAENGRCPGCGGKVRAISVAGRRAWYCPSCQR